MRISKHSQKFKLAHDFYSYCFARSYCIVVARAAFAKSILAYRYFKPVENRGDEVKVPDPTDPLTEELPPSVIIAANQDIIESLKKESLCHCKHVLKMPRCQGFLSTRTKTHCAMFLVAF